MTKTYTPPASAYTVEEAGRYHTAQASTVGNTVDVTLDYIERALRGTAFATTPHVVDVGCGARGDYLVRWADAVRGRVTGVEPSPGMQAISKEILAAQPDGRIRILDGDWYSIPVASGEADAVVGRFSLHHTEDYGRAYRELARIMRAGAIAHIAVPHPQFCSAELRRQGRAVTNRTPMEVRVFGNPVRYYFHELEDYFGLAEFRENFRIVDLQTGDYNGGSDTNALMFSAERR